MAKVKISEHTHQVNLIKWFDLQYKDYRGRLFSIPNGGKRNIIVAVKLKAEGVRPGVPDLMLPVPAPGYAGLFIEMKTEKGRPTDSQLDWFNFLNEQGYYASVCYGFEDAQEVINDYIKSIGGGSGD